VLEGMRKGRVRVDRIDVAPADPTPGQVPAFFQIADELLGRALSDAYALGDLAQSHVGVSRHADEDAGVLGEEVQGHLSIVVLAAVGRK